MAQMKLCSSTTAYTQLVVVISELVSLERNLNHIIPTLKSIFFSVFADPSFPGSKRYAFIARSNA